MNGNKKSDAKKLIRHRYGENRRITGEYDRELAVKCRNGVFVGGKTGDVTAFRGIPFAVPPTGALRWKAPQSPGDSDEVFEAYYNGKSPIQTEWKTEQASYYPQGEDCLYLNIWVNRSDSSRDKSVMVFFHGGSYGWGGTADPMYDGRALVSRHPDIVLVTVGYRTGLMGFVDFSELEGGENYPDAPNLGILDQIEALRWVKENICSFGGDPGNVTVFGESAGGGSVSLLPVIPQAKGLFRRVIAESGSVALTFSKKECREFTARLLKASRARSMDDLLALDETQLRALNEKVNFYNNFPQRDGRIIPTNPYAPYVSGVTADVDLLIGTNSNEMNYWIGEIGGVVPFRFSIPVKFENDLRILEQKDKARVRRFMKSQSGHSMWRMAEFYNEMMFRLPAICQAQEHARNGGRAYMYYWTVPSAMPLRKACHAVELAYVFGNLDETIYTGERADETLAETVMQMWTNFARTGDPSVEGLEWRRYDTETRASMVISMQPHMKEDVLREQRKLLFPLLRYMINPSYTSLDFNVPFVRKVVLHSAAAALTVAGVAVLVKKLNSLKYVSIPAEF